ncbi:MAG: hypothetical protein JNK82_05375, partial [Myxococcaceae bacterium]|nr:hypothetical protein [Myxococcaceae bacterium]
MRALLFSSIFLAVACGTPNPTGDGGTPKPMDSGVADSGTPYVDAGPVDAGPPPCPSGETRCADGCRNLRNDGMNCGMCGTLCQAGSICSNGECRPNCMGNLVDCGGPPLCVDPRSDNTHCGRCGNACAVTDICDAGNCWNVPGRAACGGMIVDTNTDNANCGTCGETCDTADGGERCSRGLCCTLQQLNCGGQCIEAFTDRNNCGGCGRVCGSSQVCSNGVCMNCAAGSQQCNDRCVVTTNDRNNCGGCNIQCGFGQECVNSMCRCPTTLLTCGTECVDRYTNAAHCGGCGMACQVGQICTAGACQNACPAGTTQCLNRCVDAQVTNTACGNCNTVCGAGQECVSGTCTTCTPGPTSDCDHDGYTQADGDCCDTPGACGAQPELLNPGAFEVPNNGIDDNCNGLIDQLDVLDVGPCDQGIPSNSPDPIDAAKAMEICRTVDAGATGADRTWGLISAQWQHANGQPLTFANGKSIRPNYGTGWLPQRGSSMVVISSGMASDATQLNPGPNGGPAINQSLTHNTA